MSDKSLREQMKGVVTESPPADPEPVEPKIEEPIEAPESKEKQKEDRTAENIRGELLRKLGKTDDSVESLRREIRQDFQDLSSKMANMTPTQVQPAAQPAANDSLDNYSVAQLEQYRSQVPDENKVAFEAYVSERKTTEKVDNKLSAFKQTQELQQNRVQFNTLAAERYPDIAKPTSDFAVAVQEKLTEYPESYIKSNPRIVLDIANEVAITKSVKPQVRRRVTGLTPAPTDTTPVETPAPKSKMSDAEREKIERALSSALPKGKKFNRERIQKREEYYGKNLDKHVKKS